MLYFDYNATAPIHPSARDACIAVLRAQAGNPSSPHRVGQLARGMVDEARATVANLVGAEPRDLVFTSGATEANQLAIMGWLGGVPDPRDALLVSTRAEHPSVARALSAAGDRGARVRHLPLDASGRLDPASLDAVLEEERAGSRPTLVSCMLVQNELGNIYPIAELARRARRHGAWTHTDATQAVGRISVDLDTLGVDLLSFSAHKLGGPPGVGALVARRHVVLVPLGGGGHQERGRRPGTENLPGIAGFSAVCALAQDELIPGWARVQELTDDLWKRLCKALPAIARLGDSERHVGNTLCLRVDGVPADTMLMAADLEGLAISAGSACASGSLEPSSVLSAMGMSASEARTVVRLSLGWGLTAGDVERAADCFAREATHIRQVAEQHQATTRESRHP